MGSELSLLLGVELTGGITRSGHEHIGFLKIYCFAVLGNPIIIFSYD